MAVVVPKKSYTIDDLWELSHRTGKRYELVRGELRELTPTGWEHGRIMGAGAVHEVCDGIPGDQPLVRPA
ncbi:MAG: hypothetical protein ACUVR7_10895 [Armatimonadota bacterium]